MTANHVAAIDALVTLFNEGKITKDQLTASVDVIIASAR